MSQVQTIGGLAHVGEGGSLLRELELLLRLLGENDSVSGLATGCEAEFGHLVAAGYCAWTRVRTREGGRRIALTAAGRAFVESIRASVVGSTPEHHRPRWDARRRELQMADRVVKRFERPAPNQEVLLDAFEGVDWKPRIANPFPVDVEVDRVDRLRDTVKRLNLSLPPRTLRFARDGSGGVRWLLDFSHR
jgi:hypothetical protein